MFPRLFQPPKNSVGKVATVDMRSKKKKDLLKIRLQNDKKYEGVVKWEDLDFQIPMILMVPHPSVGLEC